MNVSVEMLFKNLKQGRDYDIGLLWRLFDRIAAPAIMHKLPFFEWRELACPQKSCIEFARERIEAYEHYHDDRMLIDAMYYLHMALIEHKYGKGGAHEGFGSHAGEIGERQDTGEKQAPVSGSPGDYDGIEGIE